MVSESEIRRRQKISKTLKGRKTWNTGLTKETDPRIEKLAHWKGKQNLKKRTGLYKKCLKCGIVFYCRLALHKAGWGNYCCHKCGNYARGSGLRNKHVSDELKKVWSKLKKGKPLHPKVYEAYKKKYPKGSRVGSLSGHWKGGITPKNKVIRHSDEYKFWRESVFKRDDYTCKKCQKHGCYLEVDHIKRFADYPELRFEISNGQTLCRKCHLKKMRLEHGVLTKI